MILDGKKVAEKHRLNIKNTLSKGFYRKPGLAFILIGENPASNAYVKMKVKGCEEVGIESFLIRFDETISKEKLLSVIQELNLNSDIDGILVQQPLPSHLNTDQIVHAIDPKKDVDGFHPLNLGKMLIQDESGFIPCTPLGILNILKEYHLSAEGKHVVILGRSLIVGRPIANLMSQKREFCNATVTLCHSGTRNLSELTKKADILIAAIGQPHFVKKEMLKKDCIVIDVGINRIFKDEKMILTGDVDFDHVKDHVQAITPVPGGIGPMTIAMLLENTLKSFLSSKNS